MTDLPSVPISLSGASGLDVAEGSVSLSGTSNFTITQGLVIAELPSGLRYVAKYVGERNIPSDVARTRRSIYELMRRMGTPVVIKPMYTSRDADNGVAEESPNFNETYGQSRNRDPLSHGTGYVSVEKSPNEWYDSRGQIVVATSNPGPGYIQAPKYRGYGPGILTWIIEPDVAEDYYKHTAEGVLIKVQTATALTAWYPDINDNDLITHVTVDDYGLVLGTQERYQAKMTNPVSIRGLDRRGRREYTADYGNRHVVNQQFQMALLQPNHELYKVEVDR